MAYANIQSTNLEWPTTATLGLATLLMTTTLSVVGWFIQKKFIHGSHVGDTSDQTTSLGSSFQMSVMERGQIGVDYHEDGRNDTTPLEAATQQPERTANQQLQLLRLVHEEMVCSTWMDCTEFIPATKNDEGPDALDINEDNHPSFMEPPDEKEDCPKCEPQTPTNDKAVAGDTTPSGGSAEASDQTSIATFAAGTPVDETSTTVRG